MIRRTDGRRQGGFSLVEALVALVVLSVGLLGVAALYTWSLRDSRTALLRSEAVNLASDMADRIRANRIAGPEYDEGAAGAGEITEACTAAGCTPEEMAANDKAEWLEALSTTLPGGEGTVDVDDATAPFTYTITVDWIEPSLGPQTYVLRFQG